MVMIVKAIFVYELERMKPLTLFFSPLTTTLQNGRKKVQNMSPTRPTRIMLGMILEHIKFDQGSFTHNVFITASLF